jgi:anti-anti-sigma factor
MPIRFNDYYGVDGDLRISVHGQVAMTDQESIELFREKLMHVPEQEAKRVIIDFSATPYMDSTALGVFVKALEHLKKNGVDVKICGVIQSRLKSMFALTKMRSVMDIFDSVPEAMKSFCADTST